MRSVVVTGGSRGLGLAICRKLLASGYEVVALARRETPELAALPARFVACDLSDVAALPDLVKRLRAETGPFYGLVNNAALGSSGMLATMPDAEIGRLVSLNVLSPILLTKQVTRAMMADGGGGRIVNIGSIVAATGYKALSVYAAAKAALTGFTRSLARELGPLGITVNTVAPGFLATEMTDALPPAQRDQIARRSALGRMAEPEDVASLIAFLLSDEARNITGQTFTVDAGNTA